MAETVSFRIDSETHTFLRHYCFDEKITMKAFLEMAVRKELAIIKKGKEKNG